MPTRVSAKKGDFERGKIQKMVAGKFCKSKKYVT